MKALSLTQPWASLVASGAKQYETRSWSTSFRGALFIHAAKGFPSDCKDACASSPFSTALRRAGFDPEQPSTLPVGSVVAVATLTGIERTETLMRLWESRIVNDVWQADDARECSFGDYSEGRYAWRLQHVHVLRTPVPCRGALGLWTVPADVLEHIGAAGYR